MTWKANFIGAVLVALLIYAFPTLYPLVFPAAPVSVQEFFHAQGIIASGVEVKCDGDDGQGCKLLAMESLPAGKKIMQVPMAITVDQGTIASSRYAKPLYEEGHEMRVKYSILSGLGDFYINAFQFTFWLAMTRREGSRSPWAAWIAALPDAKGLSGALFWKKKYDKCVDGQVHVEADAVRKILNLSVAYAKDICLENQKKKLCHGSPPSKKELKWALGNFLSRSIDSSIIIPGLDFGKPSVDPLAVKIEFNDAKKKLEVITQKEIKAGEHIEVSYNTGPVRMLAHLGVFDSNTAHLRLLNPLWKVESKKEEKGKKEDARYTFLKKNCLDVPPVDFYFSAEGQPSPRLFRCIGAVVADKTERKNLDASLMQSRSFKSKIYGNITNALYATLHGFNEVKSYKKFCEEFAKHTKIGDEMQQYVHFALKTISANIEYAKEKKEKQSQQ